MSLDSSIISGLACKRTSDYSLLHFMEEGWLDLTDMTEGAHGTTNIDISPALN